MAGQRPVLRLLLLARLWDRRIARGRRRRRGDRRGHARAVWAARKTERL